MGLDTITYIFDCNNNHHNKKPKMRDITGDKNFVKENMKLERKEGDPPKHKGTASFVIKCSDKGGIETGPSPCGMPEERVIKETVEQPLCTFPCCPPPTWPMPHPMVTPPYCPHMHNATVSCCPCPAASPCNSNNNSNRNNIMDKTTTGDKAKEKCEPSATYIVKCSPTGGMEAFETQCGPTVPKPPVEKVVEKPMCPFPCCPPPWWPMPHVMVAAPYCPMPDNAFTPPCCAAPPPGCAAPPPPCCSGGGN